VKQAPKVFFFLLLFAGVAMLSFAQPTATGTSITNQASASFTDVNGADRSTLSNTVTTIVQTVYSFNVQPDATINPGTTDGTVDPTVVTDNDFTASIAQDFDADAGTNVIFDYSIENNSNTAVNLLLSIAQDSSDDFDLTNIKIYVDDDPSTTDSTTNNVDGVPNNYILYGDTGTIYENGVPLVISDATSDSGPDYRDVKVVATVPANQTGNHLAIIDLQVTNETAVAEVAAATYTATNNAKVLFENNNLGRVEINEVASIGVAKNATTVTNNGDGTYSITYTMTVENFSNVALSNVQIVEDLATRFGTLETSVATVDTAGEYFVTVGSPTGTIGANGSFTGSGADQNLLDASSSSLAIGATATIPITVTVYPTPAASTTINNQVTASGTTPDGTTPTDDSTDGLDPDGSDDDDTPDEDADTPVTLTQKPSIGLAKQAGTVVDNGDGTFTVPFTLTVENLGDMDLHDVQVTDSLTDEFGTPVTLANLDAAGEYNVSAITVTDGTATPAFAANAGFDGDSGSGSSSLLDLSSSAVLEVGQSITLAFDLRFYPDFAEAPFLNQASATGDIAANADATADGDTTDLSNDGTDTDSDDDSLGNEQATDYDANNDGTTATNEGDVDDDGTVGNNGTVDDNTPTQISLPTDGVIGAAKQAGTIVDHADGTFSVPFTITAENLGNVDLYDVALTDALTAEFGTNVALADLDTAGEYTITVAPAISGGTATGFTANAGFNGSSDTNLIAIEENVPFEVDETLIVTFTLRFYPDFANAPFTNQVTATGDEPDADGNGDGTADADTTDTSDDGTNPDTDDDDEPNEAGENDPTPVTITQTPVIGSAKQAGTIVDHADGTFSVPFTITAENLGNVDLYDVALTDALTAEFGTNVALADLDTAGEYTITAAPAIAGGTATGFSANTSFNGNTDTNLITISGTNPLEVDETLVVTFTLRFYPDFANAPFTNQVTATGDEPDADGDGDGTADADTTDTSNNGTDPDANDPDTGTDDDDTPDENEPTPVTITENPVLGVAKAVFGTPTNNGDGTYTLTYDINLENLGNVILSSLQVSENLNTTFAAADSYTVDSLTVTSGGLTRNESGAGDLEFNGSTDTNLLDEANAANSLVVGATATLRLVVTVTPGAMTASSETYNNSVTAYGFSPSDETDGSVDKSDPASEASTTDISDSGTNPDPNNNNVANEAGENDVTPVTLTEAPSIGVAKSASITDYNADSDNATEGPFEVTFDFFLENFGDVNLSGVTLTDTLSFGTYQSGTNIANLDAGEYMVMSVTEIADSGSTVTVNTGFTGTGANTNILGTSSLARGATAQVQVVIVVANAGSYTNTATAEGTGPGGTTTTDDSTDGTNPDGTNGDDTPDEDTDTPVVITSSNLDVVKTQRICSNSTCLDETNPFVNTQLEVNPGEWIQYQIVATASSDMTNVKVFDSLPVGTLSGNPDISTIYSTGTLTVTSTETGIIVYSTDGGTTFSTTVPVVTASGFHVGVNNGGTATTITTDDTLGSGDSITITFIVQVP